MSSWSSDDALSVISAFIPCLCHDLLKLVLDFTVSCEENANVSYNHRVVHNTFALLYPFAILRKSNIRINCPYAITLNHLPIALVNHTHLNRPLKGNSRERSDKDVYLTGFPTLLSDLCYRVGYGHDQIEELKVVIRVPSCTPGNLFSDNSTRIKPFETRVTKRNFARETSNVEIVQTRNLEISNGFFIIHPSFIRMQFASVGT
jgi:hypothetical protein